ncbi:MBL fold metallo-hydrolase, partial [Neobacillus sp.]|uniref:MBL fold metallo-hydrolase n=1 Tax=Neobacillus sp. TaxID=2675273 RepID=UPI00289AF8FB
TWKPRLIGGFDEGLKRIPWIYPWGEVNVNTHYHSDHVGGNFHLQKNYGVTIAAHKWEADLINSCDPEACRTLSS